MLSIVEKINPPITSQDDELGILQRIARGDEQALNQIYALYGQRMYAYAYRITGDADYAGEALQESLVVIWQDAKRFRGEGRAIAWILSIVHHKAISVLRHHSKTSSLENESETLPSQAPGLDDTSHSREQQTLIRQNLQALPAEQRAVLELFFYQGLSLAETAAVLNCPVGTIKSRLSYAKANLKGLLSRNGISAEDIL